MANVRILFILWPSTSNARELTAGLSAQQIWNELNEPGNESSVLGVLLPDHEELPTEVNTASAFCFFKDRQPGEEKILLVIEPQSVDEIETVLNGSDIQVMALAAPTG